ncbi:hypothetical protein ATANTOWER_008345 [Ataeniobius toweri]|uniref:Uncharacterized protein n=1 Tax=Ataeniobius toweri TaxID=208326 RepID=A0ABU7BGG1_9TELE|nr:hypothetical protein [Ataeniobius toweri]
MCDNDAKYIYLAKLRAIKCKLGRRDFLPQVEEFKYLGVLFTNEARMEWCCCRSNAFQLSSLFAGCSTFLSSPMVMNSEDTSKNMFLCVLKTHPAKRPAFPSDTLDFC